MATGDKVRWSKDDIRQAEWYVARAVLLDDGSRAAFVAKGYPPAMFNCPIARGVIVWALSNRKSMPAKLALDAVRGHDGRESFADFMERISIPERGDDDFLAPENDPAWDAVRYQREMRCWAHILHEHYHGRTT